MREIVLAAITLLRFESARGDPNLCSGEAIEQFLQKEPRSMLETGLMGAFLSQRGEELAANLIFRGLSAERPEFFSPEEAKAWAEEQLYQSLRKYYLGR